MVIKGLSQCNVITVWLRHLNWILPNVSRGETSLPRRREEEWSKQGKHRVQSIPMSHTSRGLSPSLLPTFKSNAFHELSVFYCKRQCFQMYKIEKNQCLIDKVKKCILVVGKGLSGNSEVLNRKGLGKDCSSHWRKKESSWIFSGNILLILPC